MIIFNWLRKIIVFNIKIKIDLGKSFNCQHYNFLKRAKTGQIIFIIEDSDENLLKKQFI